MIDKDILNKFNGSKVKVTAINIKCVEDIEDIKQQLINKYGAVEDIGDAFLADGKKYIKPWLPRERIGVFKVYGEQYYIEIESSSAQGRITPRRSFYPLTALSVTGESSISATINSKLGHMINYQLLDEA